MSPTRQDKGQRRPPIGGSSPETAVFVFSRDRIRALDEAAAGELGIPTILLMEHASLALAKHAIEMAPNGGVLIGCGKGNNAGDGLALARHLSVRGLPVCVVLAEDDSLKDAAGANLAIARRLGIPTLSPGGKPAAALWREGARILGDVALIVDAILGTGLSGAPRGPVLELIHAVNDREVVDAPVLAVDIPSGMDADTGEAPGDPGDAVIADRTVTFVGLKKGFLSLEAQRLLGEVYIEEIGTPRSLAEKFGEVLPTSEPPGKHVRVRRVRQAGPPGRDRGRMRQRG
jgi:NAD(P)H-hydrate epimerase